MSSPLHHIKVRFKTSTAVGRKYFLSAMATSLFERNSFSTDIGGDRASVGGFPFQMFSEKCHSSSSKPQLDEEIQRDDSICTDATRKRLTRAKVPFFAAL